MARTEASLKHIMISQDMDPEHWNWDNHEKLAIGNAEKMGKIIVQRLINGGCVLEEMFGIVHDKDEIQLWNNYEKKYQIEMSHIHVHYIIRFDLGKTLQELADLIGIDSHFVEKPRPGKYSYDNMLSYLIHIKYTEKFQYDPKEVINLYGKKTYMQIYNQRKKSWLAGREKKQSQSLRKIYEKLKVGIASGEIEMEDIYSNPEWQIVYLLYETRLENLLNGRKRMNLKVEKAKKEEK